MAIVVDFKDPFTIILVPLSPSGNDQVTLIDFKNLPQDASVSMAVDADAWITDVGANGDARTDARCFPLFTGGVSDLRAVGLGREANIARVRLASSTGGNNARFLLTRLI